MTPAQERAAWQTKFDAQRASAPDPLYAQADSDLAVTWANEWPPTFDPSLSKTPTALSQPGVFGKWTRPAEGITSHGSVLYVRGAVQEGSAASYLKLSADICAASGANVLTLEYRKPPAVHYDAPYEDVLAALGYLETHNHPMSKVVLACDSFGCQPALAAMVTRRDSSLTIPCGLYMISPQVRPNPHLNQPPPWNQDPATCLLSDAMKGYYYDVPYNDVRAMPYNSNLSGLPPTLMHRTAGENSTGFLQWQRDLSTKLLTAANDHTYYEFDTVPHIWPFYGAAFAYSAVALTAAGAWINDRLT